MINDTKIVITMAGKSQRFFDAGYQLPKFMLEINDESVFELSLISFKRYFSTNEFLFISRNFFDVDSFIIEKCNKLGIINFKIVQLEYPTQGQADTVYIGLNKLHINVNHPILIFNIDTFRPNYSFPEDILSHDGYLEVFNGSGNNWSYIKPLSNSSTLVVETAEKVQISELCSTGLYYFSKISLFNDAFINYYNLQNELSEKYIAPIYNYLISEGYKIHFNLISRKSVIFCGTPDEYRNLLN
jgi:hypothetical protein